MEKGLISVVIPFHNEEESLRELLPRLRESIDQLARPFEVILIDDASTDGSTQVAQWTLAEDSRFRLIRLARRGGQTGAFQAAFAEARGEYIIRMDADLQDDPRQLGLFTEKIDEGMEMVLGYRVNRQHWPLLTLITYIYDFATSLLFRTKLRSNSGSFIAFRAEYLKDIPFRKNDHRYLPLIVMRRGARRICHVVVRHNKRKYGKSKYNLITKIIFGVPEVLRFYRRYVRGIYDRKT